MKKNHLLTVNQLLDVVGELAIDECHPGIAATYKNLQELKFSHPKGGLIKVENTDLILARVQRAKQRFYKPEMAVAI